MACNSCETGFQAYQSVVVSIVKSGSNALLYVNNQGRNIVLIRRILLCYQLPTGGSGTLYLRARTGSDFVDVSIHVSRDRNHRPVLHTQQSGCGNDCSSAGGIH